MKRSNRLKKNTCVEFSVTFSAVSPALPREAASLLAGQGFPKARLVFSRYPKGRVKVAVFTKSLRQAQKARTAVRRAHGTGWNAKIRILKEKDWLHKWKEDYHTHPVASKFMIVPVWERRAFRAQKRHPVILDPGSAFGSGMHESTRLALRLMESLEGKFADCLDAGAGTGVLSIAAYRLGARRILGIEKDREAARTAAGNLKRNGCRAGKVRAQDVRKIKAAEPFDLICANLWPKLLLENKRKWPGLLRSGGHLIVSGILRRDVPDFIKAFRDKKLRLRKKLMGKRWTAVLYGKADPA